MKPTSHEFPATLDARDDQIPLLDNARASSDDAIIGLTLDGNITSWNRAAVRMYGYTEAEMQGQSTLQLVPKELRVVEAGRVARAAAGTAITNIETSRVHRDGGRISVSLSLIPVLDSDQRPIAIVAIEHNLARQRALETQLLQARRIEAVARVAGGVAQEFNNLNTAIIGLADFIAGDIPADSPSQADLAEIARQAMRGARLARHLLGFTSRQMLNPTAVSVDESLRTMEPLLQRLLGDGGWLTLELNHGNVLVRADNAQLELLICELVVKAADAIGGRGAIAISTRQSAAENAHDMAPANIPRSDHVEITIRASGKGLTQAPRDLDLSAVRSLVEQLGGDVATTGGDAASIEISMLLPAVPPDAAGLDDEDTAHGAFVDGTETILVVEDEDPVRAVVTRGLRANGYTVLEAKHGEDALIVAGDYAALIHLVVSDVVMPQMDGRALFDQLRNWYPTIRFLFISGYTRGAITGTELQSPSTEFLAKPFSVELLSTQVRQLLDRPRAPLP